MDWFAKVELSDEIRNVISGCRSFKIAKNSLELQAMCPGDKNDEFIVSYEDPITGKNIDEARVCRVRNGISVNYFDPYMRRRDAESMLIGDNGATDKTSFSSAVGRDFSDLRQRTFEWFKGQDLIGFVFMSGQEHGAIASFVIAPANAAFFALGLSLLQGITDYTQLSDPVAPRCMLYVAPPFRHSDFKGRQMVVHNRTDSAYEIFAYNLYPGPSAKKGIYGALLHFGEKEGWATAHASVVQVVTPYDNRITIMHEGASGGGKSEMNEHIHREYDGRILFAENTQTGDKKYIAIPQGCNLRPVSDDMTLCHPSIQKNNGKLMVVDAENGWFIRVDHIKNYGTDPDIEARSIHPSSPLLFLNIDAQPGSTALLWEHIEDKPGKPCPNPRFVLPRNIVPDVVSDPVSVNVRSFGVRVPPCTKEQPTYGILGVFHVLPPALAWIWRLVSPRGYANPSILDSDVMASEGVGSYWPFATGLMVNHANILLKQFSDNPGVDYTLCPIKHIGAWSTGFVPQWIMREYLARRGSAKFFDHELVESRCSLLGYSLKRLVVEGQTFDSGFLRVWKQPEVGEEAYDNGACALYEFFKLELMKYDINKLDPLGKKIIECFMDRGSCNDYLELIPHDVFMGA